MLYCTRLLNALAFCGIAALIIAQRDADGAPLVSGWHGLGLCVLFAIIAAALNFRGALSAAFMIEERETEHDPY